MFMCYVTNHLIGHVYYILYIYINTLAEIEEHGTCLASFFSEGSLSLPIVEAAGNHDPTMRLCHELLMMKTGNSSERTDCSRL